MCETLFKNLMKSPLIRRYSCLQWLLGEHMTFRRAEKQNGHCEHEGYAFDWNSVKDSQNTHFIWITACLLPIYLYVSSLRHVNVLYRILF